MPMKLSDNVKQRVSQGDTDLLYKTWEWQELREKILLRDHYECQRCDGHNGLGKPIKRIKLTKANTVHHIQEVRDRPDLMMEESNLISLCHECHDIVHDRTVERFNKQKPRLTEERW